MTRLLLLLLLLCGCHEGPCDIARDNVREIEQCQQTLGCTVTLDQIGIYKRSSATLKDCR